MYLRSGKRTADGPVPSGRRFHREEPRGDKHTTALPVPSGKRLHLEALPAMLLNQMPYDTLVEMCRQMPTKDLIKFMSANKVLKEACAEELAKRETTYTRVYDEYVEGRVRPPGLYTTLKR